MKKMLLSAVLGLSVVCGFAQYSYTSSIGAGSNPGGLNTDSEYPVGGGLPVGWTVIHSGPAATPSWSTIQSLPFPFFFNGTGMTQYKVSSSGVLTFTTGAGSAPSGSNATLPSAMLPDNSIGIWGLHAGNSGDNIVSKTFGSAPNRQHWIFFTSYNADGSSNNGQWTYWSIVLEETSDKIYLVDQRGNFAPTLTLGVQVDVTEAYQVTGSPNIGINNSNSADPTDNSYYTFTYGGTYAATDAGLAGVTPNPGYIAAGNINIAGTIFNMGTNAITTIDINYSDGTTTYVDSRTSLNIPFRGSLAFTHADAYALSDDLKTFDVWVTLPGDVNAANDQASTTVSGYTSVPTHATVIEEATGTWCGWCPRGSVWMDNMSLSTPDAILVAVHNSDPMVVSTYDNGIGGLIGGYPAIVIDRKSVDDPSNIDAAYNAHIGDFGFANVTMTTDYNSTTRVCDVDVNVVPVADQLPAEYRLALVFTENNVTGTGSQWDQVNYYSYASQNLPLVGAGHDWQAEPNPVPAADMEYDFVARTILGGFNGQSGSLPASMTSGSNNTYSFSHTIPSVYKDYDLTVIALLIDATSGQIINSTKQSGLVSGISDPVVRSMDFTTFPNPASSELNIVINSDNTEDVVVTLTDMLGKQVQSLYSGSVNGSHSLTANVASLDAGMYMITVATNSGLIAKPFVKE